MGQWVAHLVASLGLGESAANACLVGFPPPRKAYERSMTFNLAQDGDRGRPAAATPVEAVEWDGGLIQIHPPNHKRPRINDRKACSPITTIQACDRHRPRCWWQPYLEKYLAIYIHDATAGFVNMMTVVVMTVLVMGMTSSFLTSFSRRVSGNRRQGARLLEEYNTKTHGNAAAFSTDAL